MAALVGGIDSLANAISHQLAGIAGLLSMLLLIGIPVALIVPERTRPWGIGILIGFALWAIIPVGACVVIIAMIASGESHA